MPALTDLSVEFVSLVDRPAVRDAVHQSEPNRFLLWKRHSPTGGSMTTEEQAAALKKAQDDLTAALAAVETQKAENATLTEKVAALEKAAPAKPADEPAPIDKADLPPAVRAALEKAETDNAALAARVEKAEADQKASDELAKAERDTRLTRDYIAKAEGYKALVVKAEDFGPVLKAAAEKLTKDEFDALDKVLKAADEQIAASDLFKEQGRNGEAVKGDTAYAEATTRATELRKSDSKLTHADAIAAVFKADPDLQARHLADVRR